MARADEKPAVYVLVERWALPLVGACYVVATVGNAILHPLAEWIPPLISAAAVGLAAYWMTRGILGFQKANASTMRRETYDGFIAFLLWGGLLFAALLVMLVILGAGSNLFVLYGIAVPAGMSAGAARQWELRRHFRSKGKTT